MKKFLLSILFLTTMLALPAQAQIGACRHGKCINLDTTSFDGVLSSTENTSQKAFDVIDNNGVSSSANLTDQCVVRSDGTAKVIECSDMDIDDSGNVTGVTSLEIGGNWLMQNETEDSVDRLTVKAAGVDTEAEFFIHPTGSATASTLTISDDVNTTNYEGLELKGAATENTIGSVKAGTGTAQPLKLKMDGTDVVTVQQDNDVIIENGNVGIGTTNPGQELEVVGTVEADGLIISGSTEMTSVSTGAADNDKMVTEGYINDTLSKGGRLESPEDADSFLIWKAPEDITITDINCIVDPADSSESVVIDIQECSSTGDSCATVDATITCDNDGAADDGTLSNGTIDSGDWINLDIGTVTGTVDNLTIEFSYDPT